MQGCVWAQMPSLPSWIALATSTPAAPATCLGYCTWRLWWQVWVSGTMEGCCEQPLCVNQRAQAVPTHQAWTVLGRTGSQTSSAELGTFTGPGSLWSVGVVGLVVSSGGIDSISPVARAATVATVTIESYCSTIQATPTNPESISTTISTSLHIRAHCRWRCR